MTALQNQLFEGTKFEKLLRYRCANVFFLVSLTNCFAVRSSRRLGHARGIRGSLTLIRKTGLAGNGAESRLRFLQRIASAGTRQLNRRLEITFEEIHETDAK